MSTDTIDTSTNNTNSQTQFTTFCLTSERSAFLRDVTQYLHEKYPSIFQRILLAGKLDDYEMLIAPGFYTFEFKEVEIQVKFVEQLKAVPQQSGVHIYRRIEFAVPTDQVAMFHELLQTIQDYYKEHNDDEILVYINDRFGQWGSPIAVNKRNMATVFLQDELLDRLLTDLTKFFEAESTYKKYGVSWRRTYLLTGPPGTGKTTTIRAIAGQLNKTVGILKFNKYLLNDSLCDCLSTFVGDILVIEDIDSMYDGRDNDTEKNGVTFTDFINAVDGICTKQGIAIFMTTNYPERLDPAITRPGRVDMHIRLDYATKDQVYKMFKFYFPKSTEKVFQEVYSALPSKVTPAQLENVFFKNIDKVENSDLLTGLLSTLKDNSLCSNENQVKRKRRRRL